MAKRVCETCGKDFESRKVKAYCSRQCDPKRKKNCETCGNVFYDLSRTNGKSYCGDECNPGGRKSRKKTCPRCKKSFLDGTKQNSMTYCTEDCRRKAKVLRQAKAEGAEAPVFLDEITRSCEQCKERYTPKSANQKYCSPECSDASARGDRYEGVPDHLSRKVDCRVCGESFFGCIPHGGRSGNHFEDEHGMSTEEYQAKYPDALIYCPASIWKQEQKTWDMNEEQLEVRTQIWRDFYKENEVWNKGLTAEDHPSIEAISDKAKERLSKPENNPFYGKRHTPETKRILSEKSKALKKDFVYCRNWTESKQLAAKLGAHISKPHAVMIQAVKLAGLWDKYEFEYEKWLTLDGDVAHGIDIATKTPKKLAIEVDGCRYHGCPEHCKYDALPEKQQLDVDAQRLRDKQLDLAYAADGWELLRFWEHEIKDDLPSCVARVAEVLGEKTQFVSSYSDVLNQLEPELLAVLSSYAPQDLTSFSDEDVLVYYRIKGFPYYRYASEALRSDFKRLKAYDVSEMETTAGNIKPKNKGLGMKASKYFMRNFFSASSRGRRSCLDVFENDEAFAGVIANRREHARGGKITDATIRTGLRIRASAPSSFPAAIAKYVYAKFGLKEGARVLDPCAGFGGRMLGAKSLDLEYTGVDPWQENVEHLRGMRDWMGFEDCEVLNEAFEDVDLEDRVFDLVFTSPPHFNKETYSQEDTQSLVRYPKYEAWLEGFMLPTIQKSYAHLASGGHFVLHVSEFKALDFPGDCEALMEKVGFEVQPRFFWQIRNFLKGSGQHRLEPFIVGLKR